LYFYTNSPI